MSPVDTINSMLKRIPVLPLYAVALLPAAWLFYQAFTEQLGADPMRSLEQGLGLWALRYMLATLSVTPLRKFTGLNLIRFRRMMGLSAFYIAVVHLSVYLLLDRQLAWGEIAADLYKRPYIIFGMTAFVLLVPMALTSTDGAVRRLGAMAWRRLHKLAYPVAVLMILHYLWLVKSWTTGPLTYAFIAAVLLGLRLADLQRRGNSRPRRANTGLERPEMP
jgi:methionine sulfoxide reductase heme-binding subunit